MERMGNSLLAQVHTVPSGAEEVELGDVYDIDGTDTIRIRLDPRRTPAENASRYLKQARRFQRRRLVLPDRLARGEEQIQILLGFPDFQLASLFHFKKMNQNSLHITEISHIGQCYS